MPRSSHILGIEVTTKVDEDFVIPAIQNFVKNTLKENWRYYSVSKLVITPNADVNLLINGTDTVKVKQNQQFIVEYDDLQIKSIVPKNANIVINGYVYF